MANPNHVLLERITVGSSGASSVAFTNLGSLTNYTDLKVVISAKSTDSAAQGINMLFNGSSANFTGGVYLLGAGSGSGSSSNLGQYVGSVYGTSGTANTFNNTEVYIPNFAASAVHVFSADNVAEYNGTVAYQNMIAGLWNVASPITQVGFSIIGGSSFVANSTFSLYGISALGASAVKAPYALGGDIIATDGSYWYHAFINSGYFTPNKALSCDVLVVAGGGGGGGANGWESGGGGGAGGLQLFSAQSLSSGATLTASIGAGGGGATSTWGTQGGNSQFGALTTSIGGGRGNGGGGAGSTPTTGLSGGSGGGGEGNSNVAGGNATSGQGNPGGSGQAASDSSGGGGGGGAGGSGSSANSVNGAAGGAGTNAYSTWLSATGLGVSGYIAGGGGGAASYYFGGASGSAGSGGAGSGGTGNYNNTAATSGTAALANTGSGGGGSRGNSSVGGAGGSGVVIVRYTV